MKRGNDRGMATLMVLVLACILMILLSVAFKASYAVHKQNLKEKQRLQQRADQLQTPLGAMNKQK